MAIIHQRDTRLPPERVKLYELAVDNLLRRWHRHKEGTIAPEVQALLASELKLYEIVERLGYEAHLQQSTGQSQGDLKRGDLLDLLSRPAYFGSAALAEAFLDYIDVRAGLLLGRGGSTHDDHPRLYSFPHRTFQEYLAGCYMVRGRHRDRVARIQTHAQEGDYWQGAVQMGAEMLYFSQQETDVLDLAYDLAPPIEPRHAAQWRQAVWAAQMVALVGNQRVEEDSQGRDPHYLSRLRLRMTSLIQGDELPTLERVGAGNILATLGDPRFDAAHWHLPHDPLLGFVAIPAGTFTMGTNDHENEQPIHQVALPRYWMARYPVTVAQWQAYLQASGQQAEDPDSVQGASNHPVVEVSWHEALAYSTWLDQQMQQLARQQVKASQQAPAIAAFWEGLAEKRLRVVLPSEAEWERAARFTDGRPYPWGDAIIPEHANYYETNLGSTSPVGAFPQGRSP
jgi:formylglycine-generating enzyme required for sulfatase activity